MSRLKDEEISSMIARAKRHQTSGRKSIAYGTYQYLHDMVLNDHGSTRDTNLEAQVMHNLASLHAVDNRAQAARANFEASLNRAKKPITRARTLRDYGNFELLRGNIKRSRELITLALEQFDDPNALKDLSKRKFGIEKAVTSGFAVRIAIVEGTMTYQEGLAELRALDIKLEEYGKKPVYQLANLGWIIDLAEDSVTRKAYIQKAIRLASQSGNVAKQREYQLMLLGGEPLRRSYIISRRAAGFGGNTIKAIAKRLL